MGHFSDAIKLATAELDLNINEAQKKGPCQYQNAEWPFIR